MVCTGRIGHPALGVRPFGLFQSHDSSASIRVFSRRFRAVICFDHNFSISGSGFQSRQPFRHCVGYGNPTYEAIVTWAYRGVTFCWGNDGEFARNQGVISKV